MVPNPKKTPFVFFRASKKSLRRGDLDPLVFRARKTGQLALSVFVPFSARTRSLWRFSASCSFLMVSVFLSARPATSLQGPRSGLEVAGLEN